MSLGVLVTLIFIVVTGGIVGLYVMFAGRSSATMQKTVETRLQEVSGVAPLPDASDENSLLRVQQSGPLPHLDRVARRVLKGSSLEMWLEQTGTGMTPSSYVLISLLLGALVAIVGMMFVHHVWMAPLGFAMGVGLPPLFLRYKRSKRLYRFEEHFPEALDLMSRAVRAGHAFSAGLKMVADECGDPIGPEFRKAFDEQNFGLPLKESLNNLAIRVPLLDVRFFATAVLIQRDTGGNLSEILDNLANVVRERFKIRRQVRVHTAHGRFTGYVLLALPAFLGIALTFINPAHMKVLFEDHIGQMLLVATVVMQTIGFFWIKQVVKIEV